MSLSLFNRIGGQAAVEAAVNVFYQKFLHTPDIQPFFENIDTKQQEAKLRVFFTMILQREEDYSAERIREAHAPLVERGMNDYHFNIFISLMEETLIELNIPKELTEEFLDVAESFRKDVLLR